MEFNVSIERKHTYGIVFVFVLCTLTLLVFSQGGPIQGHPADEISPGTFQDGGRLYIRPMV